MTRDEEDQFGHNSLLPDFFQIYIATGIALFLILVFMVGIFLGLRRYRRSLMRNHNDNHCNRTTSKCPFFRIRKKRKVNGPTPREEMPLTSMHIVDNPNYYPEGRHGSSAGWFYIYNNKNTVMDIVFFILGLSFISRKWAV